MNSTERLEQLMKDYDASIKRLEAIIERQDKRSEQFCQDIINIATLANKYIDSLKTQEEEDRLMFEHMEKVDRQRLDEDMYHLGSRLNN
jgi:hypothetical protein